MAKDAYNARKSNLAKARAAKAAYSSGTTQKASSSASMGATSALDKMKMEAASEVGVNLKAGGTLTTKQAGSVGGQMVKKMINSYKGKK